MGEAQAPEPAQPTLPARLVALCEALRAKGGRPYLVGGFVRDLQLGQRGQDFDLEVFGASAAAVRETLLAQGRVDEVGQAFTVLKLSGLAGVKGAVDVALPRRDSKASPGHRGILVSGAPGLSLREAARRRDFTINALFLDPFTGRVEDPWGGLDDLAQRRLRAVDVSTFADDPLRALRAVQMAARFELAVEPATARLCASMPLEELPADRVFGEVEKMLLKARRPSLGLQLVREWGLLGVVAPELLPLAETPQDPTWHPEGDCWIHTLQVVDEAARLIGGLDRPRALAVMLGALCHDLGKPTTTRRDPDGHVRSPGHEEAGIPPTAALLGRWNVFSLAGYDVRQQTLALVAHHLKPGQLYKDRDRVSDGAIRRLARKCEPALLYRVAKADCLGRAPGVFAPVAMEWFLEKVQALDVAERPPAPFLRGRDVLALGVAPGPEVGRILGVVYERQLDGEVTTLDQAVAAARLLVSED